MLAIAMNRIGARSNTGRGRRGFVAVRARCQRRLAPERDQAGRIGALRRHRPLPRERRRAADQDRPGRETGRGGSAPGAQGRRGDRAAAPFDAGCRASSRPPPHHDIYSIEDLAQLIWDLRSVNPRGADQREARCRGGCRHRGCGRRQGASRPHRHRRLRRWHRRIAAHRDQTRGRALGAGSRRSAAGPHPATASQPGHAARRRPDEDRTRRRGRARSSAPTSSRLRQRR